MGPSSEANSSADNSDKNTMRHCAFCLQLEPYKLCGGCRKRAYCSLACQKNDWLMENNGQGHKIWCKLDCGEQDVDWEVRPVPGKGLGLIAKRPIPSKYKIIVEGIHYGADSHPAIATLSPENGSLQQKFENNEFGGDMKYHRGKNYVALRMSRANHSCTPNAAHVYCETSKCEILYACRDIQEGEEICIGYRLLTHIERLRDYIGLTIQEEFQSIRETIEASWNFTCQENCVCNSNVFAASVSKARKLYMKSKKIAESDPALALRLIDQLLAVMDSLNSSWVAKANVHYEAYKLAIQHPFLVKMAVQHITAVCDIYNAVCPISRDTQRYKTKLDAAVALYGSVLCY